MQRDNVRLPSSLLGGIPEIPTRELRLGAQFLLNPSTKKSPKCLTPRNALSTYLNIWLYFAKRSDLHGAPVFI